MTMHYILTKRVLTIWKIFEVVWIIYFVGFKFGLGSGVYRQSYVKGKNQEESSMITGEIKRLTRFGTCFGSQLVLQTRWKCIARCPPLLLEDAR